MILRFLKGIIVGIGGVAPGLSGSVLLIIFGMYRQTLDALASLLKDFRKNIAFLLPLVAGMILGVLTFSKVIDFCLRLFEMPTRFCFLGLIVGTLPMVWQEVKKEGFSKGYYFVILLAFALGIWFFTANPNAFPQVTNPNLLQKILLGAAVAMTAIVPGVDPAVFLSTLGLYLTYVTALATFDVSILLPMLIGVAGGAVVISAVMSAPFRKAYTATFSVIFGIFLSMIPNMLTANCRLGWNGISVISLLLALIGFAVSYYLGDIEGANRKLKNLFGRKRET